MSKYFTPIRAYGPEDNIFAVLGKARQLLRELSAPPEEITELTDRVLAAGCYTAAIGVIREWFPVDLDEENKK